MSPLVSGDVEELDGTEKNTLKIFKNITLIHEVGMVMLEVSRVAVVSPAARLSVLVLYLTFNGRVSPCSAAVDSKPSK